MIEEWRPVVGYEERYSVSNTGRVINRQRSREMKLHANNCGYLYVSLSKHGKAKSCRVNRVVAAAFMGPSEMWVNHKDMNRKNNCIDNLEYCTPKYNNEYAGRKERAARKQRRPFFGVSPEGERVTFGSMKEAAEVIGTSTGFVCDALHNRRQHKTCKGCKLAFEKAIKPVEVTDDDD
ncbi:NUMOD4 domain-containing protein [Lacticaseibacillus paracasei]|uniref:NUMOD4 domain-containing protein n=1 Tax=Lacticaseibacillus paracasei TaxID=1597 RepID=UPI003B508CCE